MHIYSFTDIKTSGNILLFVSRSHIIKKALYWAVICLTNSYNKNLFQILTALKWHHFTILNAAIFPSWIFTVDHTEASKQNRNCNWCCTCGENADPIFALVGRPVTPDQCVTSHVAPCILFFHESCCVQYAFLKNGSKGKTLSTSKPLCRQTQRLVHEQLRMAHLVRGKTSFKVFLDLSPTGNQ